MHTGMAQSVAQLGVTTVHWCGTDGVFWVQKLDGKSYVLCFFGILVKVFDHELCQITVLAIFTLINLILLDVKLLSDNLTILIHESFLGTLSYDHHAVALGHSNLDDMLINAVWTIQLEVDLWDQANADITSCHGSDY